MTEVNSEVIKNTNSFDLQRVKLVMRSITVQES